MTKIQQVEKKIRCLSFLNVYSTFEYFRRISACKRLDFVDVFCETV